MEEGKGARYLASGSGRQYGNALLGVHHQEEVVVLLLLLLLLLLLHKQVTCIVDAISPAKPPVNGAS